MECLAKKYAPETSDDTLFSSDDVARLRDFFRQAPPGNALVVLAHTGSGSSTLVELLVRECGDIDAVWTHPGTTRLRALLAAAGQGNISALGKRKFVVFDAFDAMLADQASNADIVEFLKKSPPTPIVCIAHRRRNAQQRIFEAFPSPKRRDGSILVVEMPRLSDDSVLARLKIVASRENIDIDDDALATIAADAHGDLRSALGVLEMGLKGSKMDEFPDGLEAAADALADNTTIEQALDLYHADIAVVPAAIFENYASLVKDMTVCTDVSDSFSLSDIVHEAAFSKQRWDLLDVVGTLSVAQPAIRMNTTMAPAIKKFGTAWSKANNRLAKLKALKIVRRKMSGVPVIEDLAYVRTILLAALARKDAASIRNITTSLDEKDVLAIMRQWKCAYTTNDHAKMKKLMS